MSMSLFIYHLTARYLYFDNNSDKMDKKIPIVSSTDSFYFQLYPSYFKVDHGFAKNMKSGCTYRLVIYKGIQKVDEMAEGIKGKLVGGRIVFQQTLLNFNLPIYTPTRNIQFAVKVYESKPNQPQVELAQHKIKSGDYIKTFKNDGTFVYRQEVQLLENFILVFDLFLHNSKIELDQIVRDHLTKSKVEERSRILSGNKINTPKKGYNSDNQSQSDISDHSRQGAMFNSKRKLSRKRGHDGKLRSKHGSRQNSQISQRQGSVRSSRRGLGPFPHANKDQHFIPSPKKASPPKVEESPRKSLIATGKQNLVQVGRKDSNGSEIYKGKQPQTPTKIGRIESNIQRSESARKQRSPNNLPTETPITPRRQVLTKREQVSKPSVASPQTKEIHNLEIKGSAKIFEIQQKKNNEPIQSSISRSGTYGQKSKPTQTLPPKKPLTKSAAKAAPVEKQQGNAQEIQQIIKSTHQVLNIAHQQPKGETNVEQPIEPAKQQQNGIKNVQEVKKSADNQFSSHQQQIKHKVQEQVNQNTQPPAKQPSVHSKASKAATPQIAVKGKQVLLQQQKGQAELKTNINRKILQIENNSGQEVKKQSESSGLLFYILFFLSSIVLFYNAITPSRRV